MTKLLNSSCTFNLRGLSEMQEEIKDFRPESRTYNIFKLYESEIRGQAERLDNYNPCNEYLEYKSFYEQDDESCTKIVKLTRLQQATEKYMRDGVKIKKTTNSHRVNKKRNVLKSLSFNTQK